MSRLPAENQADHDASASAARRLFERRLAYLLLLLTMFLWAGNWVLGRAMRAEVPPIALSFWRSVLALVCVLPWAWRPLWEQRRELLGHWRLLVLLGALGGACQNATIYIALSTTTATNGVLLSAATPITIIALSWALFGKRLRTLEWAGVWISALGVLIIVARGELQTLLELRLNQGDLWVLLSVVGWALYTALLTKRPGALHHLAFLAVICASGLLALAPFYAWEIVYGPAFKPSLAAFAAIAYSGIFLSVIGVIFWNRAVAEVGSNTAGLFLNLLPAAGALLAILLLGEEPQLFQLAGVLLILGGVTLSTRQQV